MIQELSENIYNSESCPHKYEPLEIIDPDSNYIGYLKDIEIYLNNILNCYAENFWKCLPLVDFLDTVNSKSIVNNIRFAAMNEKVNHKHSIYL